MPDSLESDSSNKIATPRPKKNKKLIKGILTNDSLVNIEVIQNLNGESKNILEKDDRLTEVSSNISSNQSVKSEDQLNLTRSKSCNDENNKNCNYGKKTGKKDLLIGIKLPIEIENFLNNTNIINNIQFQTVRKIGTLTIEERRAKIEKYLQKRKQRTWNKKISYDCRKKVADSRLRVKGRFVTKNQAFSMLGDDGIYDLDKISSSEIKDLLNLKFGNSITKKKDIYDIPNDDEGHSNDNNSIKGEKKDLKGKIFPENEEKKTDVLLIEN